MVQFEQGLRLMLSVGYLVARLLIDFSGQIVEETGVVCAESILNLLNGNKHEVRLPPMELIVRQSTKSIYR